MGTAGCEYGLAVPGRAGRNRSRRLLRGRTPLIAVEVISRSNTAESVERKLAKYFENGAAKVWNPKTRHIWRHTEVQAQAVNKDEVFGSPLLPGFEMDLSEIFRLATVRNDRPVKF